MFDNTIVADFGTDEIVFNRINQDAYSSEYFARVGSRDFRMEIKHTLPKGRLTTPESHLVRFDVEQYDTDGNHIRSSSAWGVIRTAKAVQDDSEAQKTFGMLNAFLGDSGNLAKILGRQS